MTFPPTYSNGTAVDQRFEVVLTARVTTAAMSPSQNNLQAINTARFDSLATHGRLGAAARDGVVDHHDAPAAARRSPSRTTPAVPVPGGTTVEYTRDRAAT